MDILRLENRIQHYAWGSTTAIPALLETAPTGEPWAELWMGDHPAGPSTAVKADGSRIPLPELIAAEPMEMLGAAVLARFGKRLPFLLKILAASAPLSIQVHPDGGAARAGFENENRMGIPMDAPHRTYKDPNPKPECLRALTPFWALAGFRAAEEIAALLRRLCPDTLADATNRLVGDDAASRIRRFYKELLAIDDARREAVLTECRSNVRMHKDRGPVFLWTLKLLERYPTDIGCLAPVMLNLFRLEPGEALFVPSGEIHAYLEGVGVEIMAASDNVIRAGLTPKHVDQDALVRNTRFVATAPRILRPARYDSVEWRYPAPTELFSLSLIRVEPDGDRAYFATDGPEILICMEGEATIVTHGAARLNIRKGESIFVPAATRDYGLSGAATLHRARVGEQRRG